MTATLAFNMPLDAGRELRVRCDNGRCELEQWSVYGHGHAMMAGGFRLSGQELRLVRHVIDKALWHVERQQALRPTLGAAA